MKAVVRESNFLRTDLDYSPRYSWEALSRLPGEAPIWMPQVRPLTIQEILLVKKLLTNNNPTQWEFLSDLELGNSAVYNETDTVGVYLEGRIRDAPDGYLGDMIVASRVVPMLLEDGKKVTIITPHDDLFGGTIDPRIKLVQIPKEHLGYPIFSLSLYGPTRELLGKTIPGMPILFPIHGATPTWIRFVGEGKIIDEDRVKIIKDIFVDENGISRGKTNGSL